MKPGHLLRRTEECMTFDDYKCRIEGLILHDRPFHEVEELVDDAPLSDDEKAALWLLAWCCEDDRSRRRLARAEPPVSALAQAAAVPRRRPIAVPA
jgi:hypothetical protein